MWGLEGLCTPTRRCTECTNEPNYVFAEIVHKIEVGQKRAAQRAKARDRERETGRTWLRQQMAAEKAHAAQLRAAQLNEVPLGGPPDPEQDLFPVPPVQPSATSTPGHDAEAHDSFHASDFLSPPGVDQNITYLSIDDVMNTTDIIDALTPSGRHAVRPWHHQHVAAGSLPFNCSSVVQRHRLDTASARSSGGPDHDPHQRESSGSWARLAGQPSETNRVSHETSSVHLHGETTGKDCDTHKF